MLTVATVCVCLLVLTTVIHYEVLRVLTLRLPSVDMPTRAKLIVVILGTFFAHAIEILLYAVAIYVLVHFLDVGTLGDPHGFSFGTALYFSAETYTPLGYGDVLPIGDLRLLAGVEALNGLLLIAWSASYTYISMERFWNRDFGSGRPGKHQRFRNLHQKFSSMRDTLGGVFNAFQDSDRRSTCHCLHWQHGRMGPVLADKADCTCGR